jgi:hypothetical protein
MKVNRLLKQCIEILGAADLTSYNGVNANLLHILLHLFQEISATTPFKNED